MIYLVHVDSIVYPSNNWDLLAKQLVVKTGLEFIIKKQHNTNITHITNFFSAHIQEGKKITYIGSVPSRILPQFFHILHQATEKKYQYYINARKNSK